MHPTETTEATQAAPAFAIDERDRRRPEFKAEHGARLSDGQLWWARRPRAALRLRRFPDGTRRLATMFDFGEGQFQADAEYQAKIDELLASEDQPLADPGVIERRILAQLDVFGDLIRRNYDLSQDEADELAAFDFSAEATPESVAERDGLLLVAQGLSPYPAPETEAVPS